MCRLCDLKNPTWSARRAFLMAAGSALAAPALAQVDVGNSSIARNLVPAATLENAARQQYSEMVQQARAQNTLAPPDNPQLQRLREIAKRAVPQAVRWNDRAARWTWEVNLVSSKQINAFCMPGGKIVFYTGILDQLGLTDDEAAMIMGHEMAHALREHARSRLVKSQATSIGLRLGAQLMGWGDGGQMAANIGSQLISLRFSRSDETEADLVGLELAARAGYRPDASVSLWQKMAKASGGKNNLSFLSTHPSNPDRIKQLQVNLPKVQGLYEAAPPLV